MPDPILLRAARSPRDRLSVQPAEAPLQWVVFAKGEAQAACATLGEARAKARDFAIENPGAAAQVLHLVATFHAATIIRESKP
ncbi:MAG TPA: hypothetical protein VFB02_13735 [Bradyrhizobium sp.]|nr:hypothetical protein [Bradyrhizobium sp.]